MKFYKFRIAFLKRITYNKPSKCGLFAEGMMEMSAYACRNREELELEAKKMQTRFEALKEKKLKLDETVDALRDKYGEDAVRRGKFAQTPGGHMAGGLDKARRTGITKPIPKEF